MVRQSLKPETLAGTWIVIAAYDEKTRIRQTIDELFGAGYSNVIVVDDCSTDGTFESLLGLNVHLIRHPINCGQGAALQTGLMFALRAQAQYLVTFDADGQHSSAEIIYLLKPLESNECDVTLGSRFLGRTIDMPTSRLFILKAGILFTRFVSKIKVTDTHNGFRALSRFAAEQISLKYNRMEHASEILDQIARLKLRYKEVPNTITYSQDSLQKGQRNRDAVKIAVKFLLGKILP
jgi:glycosyltransferase involved in cell wall biosynthesis